MTDVVFIHGLWVAHTAWEPWIEHFAARGHQAFAPAWPGEHATPEETRQNAADQAGFGIDELTDHFAKYLERFDTPPVEIHDIRDAPTYRHARRAISRGRSLAYTIAGVAAAAVGFAVVAIR